MFNQKKKNIERLKKSFGEIKDDIFDFKMIGKYFKNKDNSKAFQILSDKTCNDLDFNELFLFLDRTHSKIGQQYLYNRLRAISPNKELTQIEERIIEKLATDENFRFTVQTRLEKLNKYDAYHISTLFQEKHMKPPKWFLAVKLLSFTSLLSLILGFFNPMFFMVLLAVFIINLGIHFWNKQNLTQYVNSIPQLLKLNNIAAHLFANQHLKEINPSLSKSIRVINEVKQRMSFFQLETNLQGEFQTIAWALFELFKTLFLLEPLLLFGVLKRLNTKRSEIENVFEFVGKADMLISIASLRNGLDVCCKPEIGSENKIIADEIYHPLIPKCETNSITISDKSVLLTGSNMSGKTSFIRAVGLNIITGLTLNTCFAKSISFPLMRIFSAIRISDDLMNDKSYYFEEVLTIKEMITESTRETRNLFLLDELFKGTNTVERISAGKAVLSSLAKNDNIVLVSTHDIELADMLSKEYELYHFSEVLNDKNIGFDYKLKGGKLTNRNAIRILEINDYPAAIIDEAFALSKDLDAFYASNLD